MVSTNLHFLVSLEYLRSSQTPSKRVSLETLLAPDMIGKDLRAAFGSELLPGSLTVCDKAGKTPENKEAII